jgi:hypothetical protein
MRPAMWALESGSVAEPVHFLAAPAFQKFRLWLRPNVMLFKTKNDHKNALKIVFELNFKFKYEKFSAFCDILYEYPEPEPGLKHGLRLRKTAP